jgi:hypothetical protein
MEENNNIFVSSRGLLKSCDYYPNTQYSSIRHMYDYPNIEKLKNVINPSIYVCSSAIYHFIQVFLPLIDFSFILVSGDCDETIPDEILCYKDFDKFLNDKRLIHWFCQNMIVNHEKITKMPIGLDYHTLRTRPMWGPLSNCVDQEKILLHIVNKSIPFWNRKIECYSNFHFTINTKLGYDRRDALKNIDKNLIYYEENKVSRLITWNKQTAYAFVACPHGGGLDCHRNWEALCLGCIPIVKTSAIDDLYKDLPVLIVENWENITIDLLNFTIRAFKKKFENNEFNMKKLHLNYWLELINHCKLNFYKQ